MASRIRDDLEAAYLRDVARIPPLTPDEESTLFERARRGDLAARDRIVNGNLRLVVKVALKFRRRGLPFCDILQEGNIALIETVARFRPEKGFRFATYAAYWIHFAIRHAVHRKNHLIALPERKSRLLGRLAEAIEVERAATGREPSAAELAAFLGTTEEEIEALRRVSNPVLSLDSARDDAAPMIDHMAAADGALVRTVMYVRQVGRHVRNALATLSAREREVIELRFGFRADGVEHSLRTASVASGLSTEGIRLIERRALDKLRCEPMLAALA